MADARPSVAALRLRRRTRRYNAVACASITVWGWRSRSLGTGVCRRKRYNLPARLWWPTNPKKRHFSPDRRSTAAGLSSQRRPCGFQIERAPPFTDTHPPRPWLRSTSRWVSRPSPTLDARFLARLRGDRACPSTANVAVSSRRFALAHLSRPLRSDTRSPRRRRTPRRAR